MRIEKSLRIILFIAIVLLLSKETLAQESPKTIQEEESAEVFLEEYTDEFQDTFFEALKQKGIQNYDRAINLLLKCKQLQPDDIAIDHELAKVYFLDKKYIPARQYAIEALIIEPENYWFLSNLAAISEKQGVPFENLENTIPFDNESLQFNLAKYYYERGRYQEVKDILAELKMNQERSLLLQKTNDSLNKLNVEATVTGVETKIVTEKEPNNPVEILSDTLEKLLAENDSKNLEQKATEALENYPLQPDFYFYKGVALIRNNKNKDGIALLEEGLDYLFDNPSLADRFYQELADAHQALGNSSKANEYLSKIKSGFQ